MFQWPLWLWHGVVVHLHPLHREKKRAWSHSPVAGSFPKLSPPRISHLMLQLRLWLPFRLAFLSTNFVYWSKWSHTWFNNSRLGIQITEASQKLATALLAVLLGKSRLWYWAQLQPQVLIKSLKCNKKLTAWIGLLEDFFLTTKRPWRASQSRIDCTHSSSLGNRPFWIRAPNWSIIHVRRAFVVAMFRLWQNYQGGS